MTTPLVHRLYSTAPDGHAIFHHFMRPDEAPQALVLVAHGYSEHSGRYLHVLRALAEAGFAAVAPDHRGHGRSARLLGFVERFEPILEDLRQVRQEALERIGQVPVFILGHSMGGLVTVRYVQRYPEDVLGAVTVGAAVLPPPDVPGYMVKVARLLGALTPRLPIQSFFNPEKASRVPAVQHELRTDPLVYRGRIRARTGAEVLQAMNDARDGFGAIRTPMLLIHGAADALVLPSDSEQILAGVASEDKRLELVPSAYHEVLHEPEGPETLAGIIQWIREHVTTDIAIVGKGHRSPRRRLR